MKKYSGRPFRTLTIKESIVLLAVISCSQAYSAPDPEVTVEFYNELGKYSIRTAMLLTEASIQPTRLPVSASPYEKVAYKYNSILREGEIASGTLKAGGGLISGSLNYAAAFDPDPVSKLTLLAISKGVSEGINYASSKLVEQSVDNATTLLAATLEGDEKQLQHLYDLAQDSDPTKLPNELNRLTEGNAFLTEKLKDPHAKEMLVDSWRYAAAKKMDFQLMIQRSQGKTLDELVTTFKDHAKKTDDYFEQVNGTLKKQNTAMVKLQTDIVGLKEKTKEIKAIAEKNEATTQSMARIEFMGWNAQQQLTALKHNLLPELDTATRTAKIAELEQKIQLENDIRAVNKVTKQLGQVAQLAQGLNLPPDAVESIGKVQQASTAISQYLSGDVLGAAASVAGMFGGRSRPDPNAAMMGYLKQEFAKINKHLENIEMLQKKTLEALKTIAQTTQLYHAQTMASLDRIQYGVDLANDQLRALQIQRYTDCATVMNSSNLNKAYSISNRAQLLRIMGSEVAVKAAISCHNIILGDISGALVEGNVRGTLLSDAVSERDKARPDMKEYGQQYDALQDQYKKIVWLYRQTPLLSSDLVLTFYSLANPVSTAVGYGEKINELRNLAPQLEKICNQPSPLGRPLTGLLCLGQNGGVPRSQQLRRIMDLDLIGSRIDYYFELVSPLITMLQFCKETNYVTCLKPKTLESIEQEAARQRIQRVLEAKTGNQLLEQLDGLTEQYLLQQAILYGDVTTHMLYDILIDPNTFGFRPLPQNEDQSSNAINLRIAYDVIAKNAIQAENVVSLSFYKYLTRSGAANYYFYRSGYLQAIQPVDPKTEKEMVINCTNRFRTLALNALMTDNWQFSYQLSPQDGEKRIAAYPGCAKAAADFESGLVVKPAKNPNQGTVFNQWIRAPLPESVSAGEFKLAPQLLHALSLRARMGLIRSDRMMNSDVVDESIRVSFREIAPNLIDEANRARKDSFE